MACRGAAGSLGRTVLFTAVLFPWAATGLELMINDVAADHKLLTRPGLDQSLHCKVWNHSQEEELLWLRENGAVSLKEGNRVNASSLCVSPVSVDDNGVSFTCRLARNESMQVSVVLDVKFPPVLTGEDPRSVEEDGDVTIDCHTKANPPAQMTWLKDNQSLTLEKSRHQIFQSAELFRLNIQGAQKSDSGVYDCVAESPLGNESRSFYLVVRDKTAPFPLEAVIAAAVVVLLTILFAITARRERILKCIRRSSESSSNTAL